jgi:phenylalanyl-tRNA synthetase alpha chain
MIAITFRSGSLIHKSSRLIIGPFSRCYSNKSEAAGQAKKLTLFNKEYETDEWTNVPKNITDKLNRRLLHTKNHPLYHLKNRIQHFFYKSYVNRNGTPLFSVYDNFPPVVTVEQNFDR